MSLQIPQNQPLAGEQTVFQGCAPCVTVQDVVHYAQGSTISVQLLQDQCGQLQLLPSPDFEDRTDWLGKDWSVSQGSACVTANGVSIPSVLQEVGYGLTPGNSYFIEIVVDSIVGSLTVTAGNTTLATITGAGTYSFTFEAATAQGVAFYVDTVDTSACISLVSLYDQRENFTVEVLDSTGSVVAAYDWNDGVFSVDGAHLLLEIPTTDLPEGCYALNIGDECDGTTIGTATFRLTSDPCLSMRVCGGGEQLGLTSDAEFTIAIPGKLTRPTYNYTESSVRGASGRTLRHYAQRTTSMELRVFTVGESMHRFLSTLPLWQHVYLDQQEIAVDADTYEPEYADVYDVGGPVLLRVELQDSAVTMVVCDEPTKGCVPPPNFLVQLTGPNTDYILLQDGGRIKLHD